MVLGSHGTNAANSTSIMRHIPRRETRRRPSVPRSLSQVGVPMRDRRLDPAQSDPRPRHSGRLMSAGGLGFGPGTAVM